MKQFVPFFFLLSSFQLLGQQTVEWSLKYHSESNELEILADIQEGWHIYSQKQNEETGPIATSFEVHLNDTVIEEVQEPKPIIKNDPNFGGEVMYLEGSPEFSVDLPVIIYGKIIVEVVYMSCNDEGCLPPELKKLELIIEEDE